MPEKKKDKKLADVEETKESKYKKEITEDVKESKTESKEIGKKTETSDKEEKKVETKVDQKDITSEEEEVEKETEPEKSKIKVSQKEVKSEREEEQVNEIKEEEIAMHKRVDGEDIQEQLGEEEEIIEKKKEEEEIKESVLPSDLNFLPEVRKDLPKIKTGDVVRVSYKVIEGGKERIQAFEGTVIALKNTGIARTITIRKTSFGIAVERIFPLNSRLVQKIDVKKHSKVRRAKLYYLRKLKGKAARLKELR